MAQKTTDYIQYHKTKSSFEMKQTIWLCDNTTVESSSNSGGVKQHRKSKEKQIGNIIFHRIIG
jgi:hypothetical protein